MKIFENPTPTEIVDQGSLNGYFLLALVFGIGIFLTICSFVSSVYFQYKEAGRRFDYRVQDRHREAELNLINSRRHFESIFTFLEESPVSAYAPAAHRIRKNIQGSVFSCLMIGEKEPNQMNIKTLLILTAEDDCRDVDYGMLDERANYRITESTDRPLLVKTGFAENRHITINVARRIGNSKRFLMGVIPSDNLVPKNENSSIAIKVASISKINIPETNSNESIHSVLHKFMDQNFFGERIRFLYSVKQDSEEVNLTLSWIILSLGLIIDILTSYLIYRLVQENSKIKQEVINKTRDLTIATDTAIQANQTKSRFLAMISHEIRTPLNLISGMAELLGETPVTEEQHEYILTFRRASSHLLDLINDILDVAMIEAGNIKFIIEDVDIINLIEEVSDIIAPACRTKMISYSHSIDIYIRRIIRSDAKRLRQILINLLNNALKFTDKGSIKLNVFQLKENIIFEISDTGQGISDELQDRVFDAFYQIDSSSKRQKSGVGLGLSLVKTYVHRLEGEVKLHSQAGSGTTFSVSFPLRDIHAEGWLASTREQLQQKHGTGKILLISSNEEITSYISACLTWLGFDIKTCQSLRLATSLLQNRPMDFDRIIYDSELEKVSKFSLLETCKSLKINFSKFVAILPLAHRPEDLQAITSYNISSFCFNPIKIDKLVELVRIDTIAQLIPTDSKADNYSIKAGAKILVVDDDVDNKFLIQSFLANLGLNLSFADNGEIAIEIFKMTNEHFDLILTDIQMPKMDGKEMIEKIRAFELEHNLPQTPIFALTANAMDEQKKEVIHAGADGYLTKPLSKASLISLLSEKLTINLI